MFEQDYIMRVIKELVRVILKLVFRIETDNPSAELLEDEERQGLLSELLAMVDGGEINEAENRILEAADGGSADLKLALLFYSYLNDKDDVFLQKHNFSREEIKSGLEQLISRYGLSEMAEVFLRDI